MMDEDTTKIRILCVDSGRSTSGNANYCNFVNRLAREKGPFDHILRWNVTCERVGANEEILKVDSSLADTPSHPRVFVMYLLREKIIQNYGQGYELYVTTDGNIPDNDVLEEEDVDGIKKCQSVDLADALASFKVMMNIYYVRDDEELINFGLNVMFVPVRQLKYFINDMDQCHPVWSLGDLPACIANRDIIYDKDFFSSLKFHMRNMQSRARNNTGKKHHIFFNLFQRQMQNIYEELKEKMDEETKTLDTQIIRECYERNDGKRLEEIIQKIPDNLVERTRLYTNILSLFETSGLGNIIYKPLFFHKEKVEWIAASSTTEGSFSVEDVITGDKVDPSCICLLVQTNQEPLLDQNSSYVKNPMSILENDTLCKNISKRFEMHILSFQTVIKIKSVESKGREYISSYTMVKCRPFIPVLSDWKRVHINSFVVSSFFQKIKNEEEFIYGDELLWALTFLLIVKKQVDRSEHKSVGEIVDFAVRKLYFNEIFLYPITLHVKVALPFKCGLPLYIVLWYINCVTPFYAENASRNVLRLPGTRTLFDLYKEYGQREAFDTEAKMTFLENRVNIWNLEFGKGDE